MSPCSETTAHRPVAELFAATLQGEPSVVHGLGEQGSVVPVSRWAEDADASDEALLSQCVGPTLDVGCGPGRMTQALALRGACVLGLDLMREAVAQTRARGASAIQRDVFLGVPGEGRWGSVLLADGNIGIGGDPVRLLCRVADLLAVGGRVVLDLAPPGHGLDRRVLRLEVGDRLSEPFAWGVLAPEALPHVAAVAGLEVMEVRCEGSRWIALLQRGGLRP
ncbi:class I SAM-dependent methyltransferase [Janibacter alittae]|uniref:Class I SAM-dependent methyltransferase n=1 Tax=Janibacter alittae TaxID=3115209 RepID=A0ABZ2ML25_9MICO